MLWAFTAAGGMGLLLGLWFRVPALIVVSGLAAATCLAVALTNQGLMFALVMTVALLTTLQFGYVAGLSRKGWGARAGKDLDCSAS